MLVKWLKRGCYSLRQGLLTMHHQKCGRKNHMTIKVIFGVWVVCCMK